MLKDEISLEIEPISGLPRNLDVIIFAAFDRLDDSSALVSFTGEIR